MKKPNIIALPTSQMQALCDVLGIPKEEQGSMESMVAALEAADFTKLKVVKTKSGEPRPPMSIGYDLDEVDSSIVTQRKVRLGRA